MKRTLTKNTLAALALGSLVLLAGGAHADWNSGPFRGAYGVDDARQSRMFGQQIDFRRDRQMARIRAGVEQGRIGRAEFRELMHEQRRIDAMERQFRADGFIDAHEFRRIDRALDVASRTIAVDTHDRPERYALNQPRWRD